MRIPILLLCFVLLAVAGGGVMGQATEPLILEIRDYVQLPITGKVDGRTNNTTYLDFNGRSGQPGVFRKSFNEAGYGCGLTALYFDPAYRSKGRGSCRV